MSNYLRVRVPGGTYFFTVNLADRKRCLLVEHVDVLRESFHVTRAARPFDMLAVVILPDHLHCIWRLPEGDADNANRGRRSSRVSRAACPRANADPPAVCPVANAVSGSVATGNTWFGTTMTCTGTWITSTSIR